MQKFSIDGNTAGPFKARNLLAVVTAVQIVLMHDSSHGEGFRISPPGAFNLGRAGGRIAHVDDSSAVTQNPANLTLLPAAEVQLSASSINVNVDYESPTGATTHNTDPWQFLPNAFASFPITERYAAGFGVTVPFGLASSWDTSLTSPFRYTAPHLTELKTLNLNPSFAAKLNDKLSVGAGLDFMWSELTIKQFYPWAIFPGSTGTESDGIAKLKGDGWGLGANFGITWQVTERQRVAVTYRSTMSVDYDGDFSITEITPTAAALGVTAQSGFKTRINFPNIVAVGYGVQITDTIRLEADVEWLQFSRFHSLGLEVGNNALLLPSTTVLQDWDNTFTAGLGGDWKFAQNWTLRAGYQFYETPVPDYTFSPAIPDANQHVLTVGLAFETSHHRFEAAYGADFYRDRHITENLNPAFLGEYEIAVHLFALSYRYSF